MSSIWSDEPPTEPGWYYLRKRRTGQFDIRKRDQSGDWPVGSFTSHDKLMTEYFQFGPRVPDPETCAGINKGE